MVRRFAFSFAALVILGVFDGCASTPPPPAEPPPAIAAEPASTPEAPAAPEPPAADSEAAASEGAQAATTAEPPAEETAEPVAEEPKPECASTSDCQAKGKPEKGSKWACASGVCAQVKTPARKKAK